MDKCVVINACVREADSRWGLEAAEAIARTNGLRLAVPFLPGEAFLLRRLAKQYYL